MYERLYEEGSRQQVANLKPGNSDHRYYGVSEGVLVDDNSFVSTLRPSSSNVVRLEYFEHLGPCQSGVVGQIDDSETKCREHQMLQKVDGLADPVALVADVFNASHRE